MKSTLNILNLAPKVELHLHLDCSMSYEAVRQIEPTISKEEYISQFIAPTKSKDLADYISYALREIDLMQKKENLSIVTLDLINQLEADNVIYAEIRFAPLIHTEKELTAEEVVRTVDNAINEGIKNKDIKIGLILATLRHFSEEQSLETVKLVKEFKGTNVVGFDIAADEAGYPIDNHISAFNFAKDNGLNITAHAGEAKGASSIWETLKEFKPSRIGHGVRCIEDKELMNHLKENKIHLEVCPTSNIQTNVFESMKTHSIDEIFKFGISMGINTDARTISDTTLANEYNQIINEFGWTKEDFLKINIEAIEHSFANEEVKKRVRIKLIEGYK